MLPKSHKPGKCPCQGQTGTGDTALHHHPGALVCNGTAAPTQSRAESSSLPLPIPTTAAGERHSFLGDVTLQSLHGLIPEIAAPQIQSGKERRWDARKTLSSKSSKPSTGIHDHLCRIFSHRKQSLRKSLNTGAPKAG